MTRPEAVEGSDNSRFYLETWGAFFESRREPLIRWIMRRRSIQRHDAEDAYQDTVLKMLKKVQHLDGWNESGLHTFMMTTLFRSAVDQWRRDSRLGARRAGAEVLDTVEAPDILKAVAKECESLHKQASRLAVEWGSRHLEHWEIYSRSFGTTRSSCDEIAGAFNMPKARVYRIRHQIAEAIRARYAEILAELKTSFSADD